jgi:hypothetical protein
VKPDPELKGGSNLHAVSKSKDESSSNHGGVLLVRLASGAGGESSAGGEGLISFDILWVWYFGLEKRIDKDVCMAGHSFLADIL